MEEISFFFVFLAGLLSFLSPCVLPIVPGYLCFLAGTSLDKLTDDETKKTISVFKYAVAFVLGFSTVFTLLGATASSISNLLYEYLDYFRIAAGIIIILFGIHFTHLIQLNFLNRDTRFQINNFKPGLIGSYIVGISFAFGWTPCIGPILGSVLSVAASSDSIYFGVWLLLTYSAGLGIPFLLAAAGIGYFLKFLVSIRSYIRPIEIFTGLLLILFGVLILTNRMQEIAFFFIDYFPILNSLG